MKRRLPSGNGSLLLLLTSAIVACGSSGSVLESSDGGASESGGPADGAMADGGPPFSNDASFPLLDATACDPAVPADGGNGCCPGYVPDGGVGCCPGFNSNGAGGCVQGSVRRPFLVGSSMRSAVAQTGGDWSVALAPLLLRPDAATSKMLAASWLKDALEEHASVAAFARFTMLLLSVSAPPDLVVQSQRASLDEIRHARACFALAERHGGVAHGPSGLKVHDSLGKMSLAEIAALTAEEGCVGETLGAALAAEQLAVTRDPATIAVLRKIALDEARHAELAWRFVAWATRKGGPEVERAVARAVERAIAGTLAAELRTYDGIDLDMWHAHGRLTCHESRAVTERTIEEVVRPCLATVLRGKAQTTERATDHLA